MSDQARPRFTIVSAAYSVAPCLADFVDDLARNRS
jgi:hypothetical protein